MMIHEKIQTYTLEAIYGIYWGCPCKFKNDEGKWVLGRVGSRTIKAVRNRECILLLKPISSITVAFIEYLYKTIKEDFDAEEFTPERVQEFIAELTNHLELTSYVTVDVLRRQYYHVPVYNLNLFRCGIAEPIDEKRWNGYEALKKRHKKAGAQNEEAGEVLVDTKASSILIDETVEKDLQYKV